MNSYRSLHGQMLDLYDQSGRDTEEKKHEFLKLVQDHMDSVFQMVRNLERMLLFQRERLAAVEFTAGQLLDEIGVQSPLRPLAEQIATEARKRL
jgi:transcriptional regulator of acetoin/glycerol metabolism